MYNKLLLLLVGLTLHFAAFSQKSGPSIEEIASKFYNTYDTDAGNFNLSFEKRAGQWKVSIKKFDGVDLVPVGTYLFFDIDSGGYQKMPLPPKTDTVWVDFQQHVDSYQISNFHVHAYYGYDGWYKDVIATLAGKEHLSDSLLNSLARAYSSYASCLLNNQSGDAIKSELFVMPMTRNCMSAAQREQYHKIESQAILTFFNLSQKNPNFETIVGKTPIKYANEVMVEFHTYLTYADAFAATWSLPDHLYPDSIIDNARRVLKNCPANAILLSLGDNDFYPILYVQYKMGVRKDVYLINRSLIGFDRFIYMANQPQFESKPIQLSVQYQHFKGNLNYYLFLEDSSTPMNFADVIDTIRKGHRDESGALTLPGKEFIIKRTPENATTINGETIHFKESTAYILKNDWILLDILNNLNGRRVACQTPFDDSLAPLNPYFIRKDDNLFVY